MTNKKTESLESEASSTAAKDTVKKKTTAKKKATSSRSRKSATTSEKTKKTTAKKTAAKKTAKRATTKKTTTKKTAAKKAAAEKAAAESSVPAESTSIKEETSPRTQQAEQAKATKAKTSKAPSAKKINILYITPECVPFASSGGLGEVAGSLPEALNATGETDCRVIMPLYDSIDQDYRMQMKFIGYKYVDVTWRHQYMGLFSLEKNGVTYYFVDNEFYFKRPGLYGYYDDCERFVFFSKAVFEAIDLMDGFVPDVLHANDWQTAMVPVYQNSYYRRPFTKTVYTIHNIEYQGSYGREVLPELIGLNEADNGILEYNNGVNLMKGAIAGANIFSTVSETYANELKTPEAGFGLDGIVRRYDYKLRGIMNGISTTSYDPTNDKALAAPYSANDISGKTLCKKELQKMAGLPERDVPVITMISRLVPAKGIDLIMDVLDGVLYDNDVQFVMLGTGYRQYEDFFRGLEYRHPDKAKCFIEFSGEKSRKVYAGGDIFIMPSKSEPCGLSQMIAMRYGDVPVVRETGGLADSVKDCTLGDGSGFTFKDYNSQAFGAALNNALSRCYDKDNWKKLVEHDMKLDFSWNSSALKYIDMYKDLVIK